MELSIKVHDKKIELSELSKRFLEVLEFKNYTGYKLAKEVPEVTESKITFIRNGRNEPSKSILDALLEKFPDISKVWLLTGEGEKLNDGTKTIEKTEPEPKGVPYYDIDFTLSFLTVENETQIQPDSYINHPFFKGCDYVVRASGQSMAKVIAHGDAIGLIKVENWQEFFPFGEIYAIVTKDGFRMIKVITKSEDDNYYTLISKPTDGKRDEFPSQQIKRDSILSIFKVQASSHLF